jgi:hypothetical protein
MVDAEGGSVPPKSVNHANYQNLILSLDAYQLLR